MTELGFRVIGTLFELAGSGTVLFGIYRRIRGAGHTLASFLNRGRDVSVLLVGRSMKAESGQFRWNGIGANLTPQERIVRLEQAVSTLREEVDATSTRITENERAQESALSSEQAARGAMLQEIKDNELRGIGLEVAGVMCFVLGLLLTTFPEEALLLWASLIAYTRAS